MSSTQLEEGPPPCIARNSKTIFPLNSIGITWTLFFSNYSISNFASSLVELDSNKVNKKRSKEINPIRRVCGDTIEGGCCARLWQE
jgi:hypothetical protein